MIQRETMRQIRSKGGLILAATMILCACSTTLAPASAKVTAPAGGQATALGELIWILDFTVTDSAHNNVPLPEVTAEVIGSGGSLMDGPYAPCSSGASPCSNILTQDYYRAKTDKRGVVRVYFLTPALCSATVTTGCLNLTTLNASVGVTVGTSGAVWTAALTKPQ